MSPERGSLRVGRRDPHILPRPFPALQYAALTPCQLVGTEDVGLGSLLPSPPPLCSFSQQTSVCLERASVGCAQDLGTRGRDLKG